MTTLLAVVAENPGVLENIQKTFGLNGPFFVAQVVNFVLVIFVLKKFAFGPIQVILEERRTRIADGEAKLEKSPVTPPNPGRAPKPFSTRPKLMQPVS